MAKPISPNLLKAKPFKKNDPRINRKGRPPRLPNLETLLAEVLGEDKDGITAAKAILMGLRAKASKGDVRAAEVLLERAYGKVKQDIGLSGATETTIRFVNDNDYTPHSPQDSEGATDQAQEV